jgi:predicted MFS family arabinose efflux permease
MMLQMSASNTVLQTVVDEDKRGRVMSFFTMAFFGTVPLGSLFAGVMAERFGAQNTIAFGGASCIVGSLMFLRRLPELRRLARPVYVRLGILPDIVEEP